MTRILQTEYIEIKDSKTIVSFDKKGDGDWKVWHRLISIDGKPAYEIGNICNTCSFYFERLDGANQSIHPDNLVDILNSGLSRLDSEIIKSVSSIIPNGKYKVVLITVYPKIVDLGKGNDYFAKEQVDLWGIDGFYGLPHNPKINYYRGTDQKIKEKEKLYEFIIPIFPQTWLDKLRIDFYKDKILNGNIPTAIGLSVLDIKAPAVWNDDIIPEYTDHWCLAHYILDGHHKIFAANELGKPINLMTFLAIDECIHVKEDDIKTMLNQI